MGCWNETCGLSNISITYEDEVYVFIIEGDRHVEGKKYSLVIQDLLFHFQ